MNKWLENYIWWICYFFPFVHLLTNWLLFFHNVEALYLCIMQEHVRQKKYSCKHVWFVFFSWGANPTCVVMFKSLSDIFRGICRRSFSKAAPKDYNSKKAGKKSLLYIFSSKWSQYPTLEICQNEYLAIELWIWHQKMVPSNQ